VLPLFYDKCHGIVMIGGMGNPPHPIRDRPSAPAPLSISIEGKGLAVTEYYGCPYRVYIGDVWSIVGEQGCTRMVYVCYGCDRVCVWV